MIFRLEIAGKVTIYEQEWLLIKMKKGVLYTRRTYGNKLWH